MANTNSVLYQVGQAVKAGLSSAQIDGVTSVSNPDGYNIGIGTTSPLHKLHVDGAMSVGGSHHIYGLQFSYNQASGTESTIRANTDYNNGATLLKISTNNNTNQLVLKGDGNVGIGTTNPGDLLEVGDGTGSSNVTINHLAGAGANFRIENAGNLMWQMGVHTGGSINNDFIIDTSLDPTQPKFILKSNGNVGIGTTSPAAKLDVSSASGDATLLVRNNTQTLRFDQNSIRATTNNDLSIFTNGNAGQIYLKQTSGNVGIGTTSPSSKLDVQGGYINVKANGGLANLRVGSDGFNDIFMPSGQNLNISAADDIAFKVGSQLVTRMYINGSNGNVGIGTTPHGDYKLDVDSTGVPVRLTAPGNSGMELWNAVATGWEGFIGTESGGNGLRYNSRSGNHAFYNNSVKAVEIDSSGNLDITGQYLQNGSPISTGGGSANINWGTTPGAYAYSGIDSSGLYIEQVDDGTGLGKIRLQTRKNNSGGYTQFYVNGEDNKFTFGGGDVQIANSLFLQGNLAIGATVAYEKLAVTGNVHAYGTNPNYYLGPDANARDIGFQRAGTAELAITRFNSGWHESMRIDANGNVGIGVDDPVSTLHVDKNLAGISNAAVAQIGGSETGIDFSGIKVMRKDDQSIQSAGSSTLEVINNGAVDFTVTGNGNVGIGTTNPYGKLHVQANADAYASFNYASSGFGGTTSDEVALSYSNKLHFGAVNSSNNPQVTMSLLKDGKVGIGTTDPLHKLHINGGGTYATARLAVDNVSFDLGVGGSTASNADLRGKFYLWDETNNKTRLVIDSSGNVGIGTTTPSGKLDVRGGFSYLQGLSMIPETGNVSEINSGSGGYGIQFKRGSTETMIIDPAGNVGIGTTSPTSNLHVTTTPQTSSQIRCGDDDQQQYSWLGLMTDSGNTQIWHGGSNYSGWGGAYNTSIYNSNGDFTFHPQAQANKVVINNVGLGINTGASGPVTELQIKGSSSGMGIEMGYSPSAGQMFIQSYNRTTARYANLLINPGSATNGATTQVGQKIQLTGDGQGRFGGWYGANNGGFRDAALEVGVSGGDGWILPYDRNANTYLPQLNLQCSQSKISMRREGSTHITGTLSVPSNPHYSFRRMSHVTSSGTIGDWNTLYSQTGSDFNSTTGVFTAPITGKYLFTITGLMYGISTSNSSNTWLGINGNNTFFMGQYSMHSGSYNGFSGSHAVWLNANDYANYYHTFTSGGLHSSYLNMSITYIS